METNRTVKATRHLIRFDAVEVGDVIATTRRRVECVQHEANGNIALAYYGAGAGVFHADRKVLVLRRAVA